MPRGHYDRAAVGSNGLLSYRNINAAMGHSRNHPTMARRALVLALSLFIRAYVPGITDPQARRAARSNRVQLAIRDYIEQALADGAKWPERQTDGHREEAATVGRAPGQA